MVRSVPSLSPHPPLSPVPRALVPAVTAVVFDFDGTLAETNIDFAAIRAALRDFFAERGVWDETLFQRYILEMIDTVCARLSREEATDLRVQAMAIVRQGEFEACRDAEPYPGVPEALRILERRGYRLGIFTRNARECCKHILGRHPLPYSVLLTRDDVANVKPHPEHLQQVLARLDCPPDRALVVGDHYTDVETARAVGAPAIGVLTTHGERERFMEAGALLVIDSVADLPPFLPDHPA